jgi:type IV pilus assembly protein PilW
MMGGLRFQRGISLIELIVSIALGLVLIAGVLQLFMSTKQTYTIQENLSRMQESGRLAVEIMARDLRAAGYFGCFRPDPAEPARRLQNGNIGTSGFYNNFNEYIRAYKDIGSLDQDQLTAFTSNGVSKNPSANTPILVVRYAGPQSQIISEKSGAFELKTQPSASLNTAGDCAGDLCIGKIAVVSDCFRGRLFQISNIVPDNNHLVVSHADDWSNNLTAQYSTGEVYPVRSVVYFIADNVAGIPSLWQKINNESSVEILEGVENASYQFLSLGDSDYKTIENVTDWGNVVSIHVSLVLRSAEKNVIKEQQSYYLDGNLVAPEEDDYYLRQVFGSTISLRSPLPSQ